MVSFTTSEILIDTTATISGQSAIITGLGSSQFKAVYSMAEGDTEGVIAFEISIIDVQGNPLIGTSNNNRWLSGYIRQNKTNSRSCYNHIG